MLISPPEWIAPQILLLGSPTSCLYLVKGDAYVLIGGGVAWEVPLLESQLDRFDIDRRLLRYLIISHAHHDHCGAVPYLRRRYPHLRVVASEYCARLLKKPAVVALMNELNCTVCRKKKMPLHVDGVSLEFDAIAVDELAADGSRLESRAIPTLEFYTTPGHSRCSLTTYLPAHSALFPGDALPLPRQSDSVLEEQQLIVTANHDFDDYLESIAKLRHLDLAVIGYEHGGALTGTATKGMVERCLAATLARRQEIVERYHALGDMDRVCSELTEKYRSSALYRDVPVLTLKAILHRMVCSALGRTGGEAAQSSPDRGCRQGERR